jgi:hypothetical protein
LPYFREGAPFLDIRLRKQTQPPIKLRPMSQRLIVRAADDRAPKPLLPSDQGCLGPDTHVCHDFFPSIQPTLTSFHNYHAPSYEKLITAFRNASSKAYRF